MHMPAVTLSHRYQLPRLNAACGISLDDIELSDVLASFRRSDDRCPSKSFLCHGAVPAALRLPNPMCKLSGAVRHYRVRHTLFAPEH